MKNKISNDSIYQITMLLQVSLGIFALTFAIAAKFEKELFIISQILVGILMFIIAYNNQKIYKRKYMTYIYLGLGIVIIATSLFA